MTKSEKYSLLMVDFSEYCSKYNISIEINPIGTLVVTDVVGRKALGSCADIATMVSDINHPPSHSLTFEESDKEEIDVLSLERLFEMAKRYNLDITISGDHTLNVFDGGTERQATMSVSEMLEYIQYLELKFKFDDRME